MNSNQVGDISSIEELYTGHHRVSRPASRRDACCTAFAAAIQASVRSDDFEASPRSTRHMATVHPCEVQPSMPFPAAPPPAPAALQEQILRTSAYKRSGTD